MRVWMIIAVIVSAAVIQPRTVTAQVKPDTAGLAARDIQVRARPIAKFWRGSPPAEHSRLAWRGGLVLTSPSKYFGGWSGLAMSQDGERFVAVSDGGIWMTGTLSYDGVRPKALRSVRLGALLALQGKPLHRMRDRDAEAIAIASGTLEKGTVFIAFEQNDRIGVFPIGKDGVGPPARYLQMPAEAKRMRMDGVEALTVLGGGPRKGALVAFSENPLRGEKHHRGWIWRAGTPQGFTVPGIDGYSITDAASLPDGSVLLLERRFRWLEGLRVRLRLLAAEGLKPGGSATGEILLAADSSQEIDNLEALAVSRGTDGETVVTLMSDDNFNGLFQRTVLLQFTLKDTETARAAEAVAKPAAATP